MAGNLLSLRLAAAMDPLGFTNNADLVQKILMRCQGESPPSALGFRGLKLQKVCQFIEKHELLTQGLRR